MLDTITWEAFEAFIQTNWGWAAGLAASMAALTLLADGLLAADRKADIRRFLSGRVPEENWTHTFTDLFDAVFGKRHLSLTCFVRSAIASLIAVALIWVLMGEVGAIGIRLQKELSLGSVLLIALAVNIVADYVSLLETRWLLGRMHRIRSGWAQAGVLLADLVFSTAIIWLAILAYVHSPLHEGEIDSFAEILGVFSIFSVIFYSTFLTSVWTWSYIFSTWVLRLIRRVRLAYWLDVEEQPVRILSLVVGATVFAGALALSVPLSRDADGLSRADRALCEVFKGEVCLSVAGLTGSDQARLDIIEPILAECESTFTTECIETRLDPIGIDLAGATKLFELGCSSRHVYSCTNLGALHELGIGVEVDHAEAARLYQQGCTSGNFRGCSNLGMLYHEGLGVALDYDEAARLYLQACDGGNAGGCANLGRLHSVGLGVSQDLAEATRRYRQGCDGGVIGACTDLGYYHLEGNGVALDYGEAARLSRLGCDGENGRACNNLGYIHRRGLGVPVDYAEASRLYQKACEVGEAEGCTALGTLHERGLGTVVDYTEAARLYRQGCDGGSADGCTGLGELHRYGDGMEVDYATAARLYQQGCDGGSSAGCSMLGVMHKNGLGMEVNYAAAARFTRQGCDGGHASGCTNLGLHFETGLGLELDYAAAVRF